MITTDCAFMQNDLFEVANMFPGNEAEIAHSFNFKENAFLNSFTVDGKNYSFKDEKSFSGELEFKRFARRYAKIALYSILSEKYAVNMPWGALTGIRPVKLAYGEIAHGEDFIKSLRDMRVCEDNIKLVSSVIKNQSGIYDFAGEKTDMFISIPFCPTKCEYCSFITAPITQTRKYVEPYIEALISEIERSLPLIKGKLRSIYVGGGTPLVLEAEQIEKILTPLKPILGDVEFTVEAGRPDVFTDKKLAVLKDCGVTRICINPQSFINSTLVKIGRKHTAEDVFKAFDMAEKYSFDINLDLIAGLADENSADFAYSLNKAIELKPQNITVHTLCLKKGAKLKEEKVFLDGGEVGKMIAYSRATLSESGYSPYYLYRQKYMAGGFENTGWTVDGKACIYNIDVMEEISHNLAVGANAISKRLYSQENRIARYGSPKDLPTYLNKLDEIMENKKKLFE